MNITIGLKIAAVMLAFLLPITLQAQTINEKKSNNTIDIFPKGEKSTANFTGTARVKTLVANDDTLTTIISNVEFEAGARNYWQFGAGMDFDFDDINGYYST